MISRAHGLVLSLLLGAASVAGAYAIIVTAHLGDAETKPEVVSSRQIAKQARKLDAWEASLQKALKTQPPALPALNRYAAVMFVAAPGATTLPVVASVRRRAARQAKPADKAAGNAQPKPVGKDATPGRSDDASEGANPVAVAPPERSAPAAPAAPAPAAPAAPAPAVVVVAAAPAATPASTPTPPATLSVEQQCRQLLRAAEGKSEQVKQDAEKQCEALKQAAEKQG